MVCSLGSGLRIGVAAATLCMGGLWGAYTVAQTAAEQAFAQAIERLRAALPAETVLEHGAVSADPVSGRLTIADVAFGPRASPQERLRVPRLVIEGLQPRGAGIGQLSADAMTLDLVEGSQAYRALVVGSFSLSGLGLPAEGQPFDPAAITLDRLEMRGIELTPALPGDGPAGRIGRIAAGGIGGDRSDRLEVEGIDLRIPQGSFIGERFRIARIAGSNVLVLQTGLALRSGDTPPVPRGRSRFSVEGLSVHEGEALVLRMARLDTDGELENGNPDRPRGTLSIDGFESPQSRNPSIFVLRDAPIQASLRLAAEADIASGDMTLHQFRLELAAMGTFEMALRMSGLGPKFSAPTEGRLHGFTFRYTDAGLVARALAEGAKQSGMRAEELREQIVQMSPMLFSGPGAEPNLRALRAFLANPGSLTVTAAPATPVRMSELERLSPDGVTRLLNITVTSP
jgi:hypothetical protein